MINWLLVISMWLFKSIQNLQKKNVISYIPPNLLFLDFQFQRMSPIFSQLLRPKHLESSMTPLFHIHSAAIILFFSFKFIKFAHPSGLLLVLRKTFPNLIFKVIYFSTSVTMIFVLGGAKPYGIYCDAWVGVGTQFDAHSKWLPACSGTSYGKGSLFRSTISHCLILNTHLCLGFSMDVSRSSVEYSLHMYVHYYSL